MTVQGGITLPVGLDLKNVDNDVKKIANSFKETTRQIDAQKKKVDELRAKLAELENGKSFGENKQVRKLQADFDKATASVEKTKAEILGLYAQLESIQGNPFISPTTNKPMYTEREQKQIDTINSKLDQLEPKFESGKKKAEQLGQALKEAMGTATQAEVDATKNKLSEAELKLEKLQIKSDELKGKLKKNMAESGNAVSSAGNAFEKLGNRIVGFVKRVFIFSMLTTALRGLRESIGSVLASNTGLQNSLYQLQAAFWTAFAPVLSFVVPVLRVLINWITNALIAIGKFIAFLTGTSYKAMTAQGKALKKQAAGYGKSAKSAAKSTKANKDNAKSIKDVNKELASFDELLILQEKQQDGIDSVQPVSGGGADGGGVSAPEFDYSAFDELTGKMEKLEGIAEKLQTPMEVIAGAFAGWVIADKTIDFFENVSSGKYDLSKLEKQLGGALIGAGVTLAIENISAILSGEYDAASLVGLIKSVISGVLVGAGLVMLGVGGAWIIPVSVVLSILISDVVANKENIKQSFEGTIKAIKGLFTGDMGLFAEGIDENLVAAVTSKGLTNKIFNAFGRLALGKEEWDKITKSIEENGGAYSEAWNKIFQKFGDDAPKVFLAAVTKGLLAAGTAMQQRAIKLGKNLVSGLVLGIQGTYKKIQTWCNDHILQPIKNCFGIHSPSTVFEELGGNMVDGLVNGITATAQNVIEEFKTIWANIQDVFVDIETIFKGIFDKGYIGVKNAFSSIGTWFAERWTDVKNIFNSAEDGVASRFKVWFESGYKAVTDAFSNIKKWASDRLGDIADVFGDTTKGVKEKFGGWFADAFQAVKDKLSGWGIYFQSLWDTVKNKFTNFGSKMGAAVGGSLKSAINTALAAIEKTINKGINAINSCIDFINQAPIFPDIGRIPTVTLPRLAQGAVIPPNREFMAILGDQKHGTNIEAPLDTIKQAVREVLANNTVQQNSGAQTVILELDGREVGRTFGRAIQQETNRAGKSFVKTRLVFG